MHRPRLRSPSQLAPPPVVGPLRRGEEVQARAVHVALIFAAIALHAEGFTHGLSPCGDSTEEHWEWFRQRLRPMALWSPTLRDISHIFDVQLFSHNWWDERRLRREIRRLDRVAHRLGERMSAIRPVPLRLFDEPVSNEDLFADAPAKPRKRR